METSVGLQEPFSYELWPVVVSFLFVLFIIVFFVVSFVMKKMKNGANGNVPVVQYRNPNRIAYIKSKYLKEISKIENDYEHNKISVRTAYQKMSKCIRKFVHEMTGIRVHNYTLQDIKALNMPLLEELIEEYYAPEFAKRSEGNTKSSLEKTKRAIERWN